MKIKTKIWCYWYEHYTSEHLDERRKIQHITRHRKGENWHDPDAAGYWSHFPLV